MAMSPQELAAKTAQPGVWINAQDAMPEWYEEVRVRDSENYERIARRSKKQKGIWQFSSFEHEGSKYPWPNSMIVAWTRIYPVDVKSMDRTFSEGEQAPSAVSATEATKDWVNCPVCGETDMAKSTDGEGNSLIKCVNHCCASNGGLNHSALEVPSSPAEVPVGYEVVQSSFLITSKALAVAAAKLLVAMEDREKADASMTESEGSNVTVFLLAGDKLEAEDRVVEHRAALRKLAYDFSIGEKSSTIPSSAPRAAALTPELVQMQVLTRDFVKSCSRFGGKQVCGNDLSASATRLLTRIDELPNWAKSTS